MYQDSGLYPSSVTPVLAWPGGKRHMLKKLLPLITLHKRYIEAFAGGLAVYLSKPRSEVEIVNDLNGNLVALYRCAQYHLPELLRELNHQIASRQVVRDYVAQPGLTDIQRAARFLFLNRASFGGDCHSFGVSKVRPLWNLKRLTGLLESIHNRLAGTTVENLPYDRLFKNYDGEDAFWFLDPPYLNASPGAYDGWTADQMTSFAKAVLALKGAWLVTVDDSPLNRDLFAGCQIQPVTSRNRKVNHRTHHGQLFGELIIRPALPPSCTPVATPVQPAGKCIKPLSIRGLPGKSVSNLRKRALRA